MCPDALLLQQKKILLLLLLPRNGWWCTVQRLFNPLVPRPPPSVSTSMPVHEKELWTTCIVFVQDRDSGVRPLNCCRAVKPRVLLPRLTPISLHRQLETARYTPITPINSFASSPYTGYSGTRTMTYQVTISLTLHHRSRPSSPLPPHPPTPPRCPPAATSLNHPDVSPRKGTLDYLHYIRALHLRRTSAACSGTRTMSISENT